MNELPSIKVGASTRELVRLGAAMNHCSQGAFVDEAVAEFIANHREELEAGLVSVRETLGLDSGAALAEGGQAE